MKFVSSLKGFSGCKIDLYSENGNHFVRKISASLNYNNRLKRQMDKQQYFFDNLSSDKISAPKVLRSGVLNDLFYFDMEYIRGFNLVDHIYDVNFRELEGVAESLCNIINIMKKSVIEGGSFEFNKMEDKLGSLIYLFENKKSRLDINLLIELKKLLSNIEKKDKIKSTFCHGDLTMENIIFDKDTKKIFLIDFLDSFIDHYWMDITKLFQDIEGKWYKFRNPDINLVNFFPKMEFVGDFIKKNILTNEEIYNKNHPLFLALNFARILPYAQDNETEYLNEVIKENINKFKNSIY